MRRELRRRFSVVAVLLVLATATAGCGSDSSDADEPAGTGDVATIDITVSGGEITPNGDEVAVSTGQEIDLVVTADAPGEIHVHSDPEHEFEYEGTGEPETFPLTIDRPGQVEVESHTLDKLIVKLVVS
ncbi:hypothetical protein BH09ACT12_BH09ACT12_13380 [soil metagenome]